MVGLFLRGGEGIQCLFHRLRPGCFYRQNRGCLFAGLAAQAFEPPLVKFRCIADKPPVGRHDKKPFHHDVSS